MRLLPWNLAYTGFALENFWIRFTYSFAVGIGGDSEKLVDAELCSVHINKLLSTPESPELIQPNLKYGSAVDLPTNSEIFVKIVLEYPFYSQI